MSYDFDAQGDVRNYDVTADGQCFLMLRSNAELPSTQFHVVLNWLALGLQPACVANPPIPAQLLQQNVLGRMNIEWRFPGTR